jgi:hypothetical protein
MMKMTKHTKGGNWMSLDTRIEKLAGYMHELWVKWYEYMDRVYTEVIKKKKWDDDMLVGFEKESRDAFKRWVQQSKTCYDDLSDDDKEKDRVIAREILKLIGRRDDDQEETNE